MPLWLTFITVAVAALITVYAAHRVLRWMARRGWGQYGKRRFRETSERGGGGGMAGVLSSFQQLVEPEIRYVMEEKDQRKAAAADEASPADR
jgi:hypothetical protein